MFHAAAAIGGEFFIPAVTGVKMGRIAAKTHVVLGGQGIGKADFRKAEGADDRLYQVGLFRFFRKMMP